MRALLVIALAWACEALDVTFVVGPVPSAYVLNVSAIYAVNTSIFSNVTSYDGVSYVNVDTCPPGSFSHAGNSTCSLCSAGRYSNKSASTGCGICPAGTFSLSNYSACVSCAPGHQAYAESSVCTACAIGSYLEGLWCAPCAAGTITASLASSECDVCRDGTYAADTTTVALGALVFDPYFTLRMGFYFDMVLSDETPNVDLLRVMTPELSAVELGVRLDQLFGLQIVVDGCDAMYGAQLQLDSQVSLQLSLVGDQAYVWANSVLVMTSPCSVRDYLFGTVAYTHPSLQGVYLDNIIGGNTCRHCINNTFSLPGSSGCLPCPGNSTSLGFSSPCLCDAGFDASVLNSTDFECLACPPGFVSLQGGECTICPAGTYQSGVYCVPCSAWSFSSSDGSTECDTCYPGLISGVGATECSQCEAGYYANPTTFLCSPCPLGTWGDGILYGVMQCTGCGPGKYSTSAGSSSAQVCQSCPPGRYSIETKSGSLSNCKNCSLGTYSLAGYSACPPCLPGSYSLGSQSACTLCMQGQYQALSGTSNCSNCSAGYFSGDGQSLCTPCDNGTFTPVPGTVAGACKVCNAGEYSDSGSTVCSTCLSNEYSYAHAASCQACPEHSLSPAGSRLDQCVCVAGYRYDRPAGLVFTCQPCLPGSWSSNGSEACTLCEAGTASSVNLSVSVDTCLPCLPGFYTLAGMSSCMACPAGKFTGTNRSGSCGTCAMGMYSTSGSSGCSTCALGLFIPYVGVDPSDCRPCAAGTFQPQAAMTACIDCTAGSYAEPGSTRCLICPNNTFSGNSSGDCTGCPMNSTSSSGSDALGCQCDAGFYPFYRTRASGGLENVQILDSGLLIREHIFTADDTLLVLVRTTITETCDSVVELEAEYNPGLIQVYMGPCSEVVFRYVFDGEFYLGESPTFFMCEACSPGFVSLKLDVSCTACIAGYYQSQYAKSSCIDCAAGFIAPEAGTAECQECLHGTFDYNNTCELCPVGYSSHDGNTTCFACAGDQYTVRGVGTCMACPLNSTSAVARGLDDCLCNAGYFKFSSSLDAFCLPCEPGYFSGANQTACVICGTASYCPGGLPSIPCPLGTYSNVSGLASADQCAECPADYFCQSITDLEACPGHTHSSPGTLTALECICNTGYMCSYQKAVRISTTLPLTPSQFQEYQSQFLASLAAAAGVPVGQVSIISSYPVPGRRLLAWFAPQGNHTVEVHVRIHGIHRFGYSRLRVRHGDRHHSVQVVSRQDHFVTVKGM